MTDKIMKAKQLRRAIQLWAGTLSDESTMMEIASIYPAWTAENKYYKTGEIFSYGVNADGEIQLYTVLQPHTSKPKWTPDTATSLYKKVGFNDSGVPIWTQPLGATDAYQIGDKVEHDGKTWESEVANNVWEPGVYGWHEVTA